MTRDEILQAKAGRELDDALAPLLGYEVHKNYHFLDGYRSEYRMWTKGGTFKWPIPLSATWEGMRLVVEAMAAKGWYVSIQWPIGPSWGGQCYAVFVDSENNLGATHTDETAPLAVCKAARLAMKGEDAH